jgi:hypothetical protein
MCSGICRTLPQKKHSSTSRDSWHFLEHVIGGGCKDCCEKRLLQKFRSLAPRHDVVVADDMEYDFIIKVVYSFENVHWTIVTPS